MANAQTMERYCKSVNAMFENGIGFAEELEKRKKELAEQLGIRVEELKNLPFKALW